MIDGSTMQIRVRRLCTNTTRLHDKGSKLEAPCISMRCSKVQATRQHFCPDHVINVVTKSAISLALVVASVLLLAILYLESGFSSDLDV